MNLTETTPLPGRIIVKLNKPEEITKSGIIITTVKQKIFIGTVVKAGKDCKYVEEGQKVVIEYFDGIRQENDSEVIVGMLDKHLSAVIVE